VGGFDAVARQWTIVVRTPLGMRVTKQVNRRFRLHRTVRLPNVAGAIALLDSQHGWYIDLVTFTIEIEREDDGRWLAEVPELCGVMAYGQDRDEAVARVQALALRVIAERLEHREAPAEFVNVTFQAA
jgi:predicted RNase H-like HicB family nuclease